MCLKGWQSESSNPASEIWEGWGERDTSRTVWMITNRRIKCPRHSHPLQLFWNHSTFHTVCSECYFKWRSFNSIKMLLIQSSDKRAWNRCLCFNTHAHPQNSLFIQEFWPCMCDNLHVEFAGGCRGMQGRRSSYMLAVSSQLLFHTRFFEKGWASGSLSVAMRERTALYSLWLLSVQMQSSTIMLDNWISPP